MLPFIPVPTSPLADFDVVALGDGSVGVGWAPLSLAEARGFPLYIVSYTSVDGAVLGSVNTTNSSVIITGLNPNIGYIFTIQVATGSGNGPTTTSKLFVHILPIFPFISCEPFHNMYWAVSFNYSPSIYVEYLKGTLPSPSCDTTADTVGAFFGGAIFGATSVALVVGIVFGVFKLRRKANIRSTKKERFVLLFMRCVCDIRTPPNWGVAGRVPTSTPVTVSNPMQYTPLARRVVQTSRAEVPSDLALPLVGFLTRLKILVVYSNRQLMDAPPLPQTSTHITLGLSLIMNL